jgi:hypothetical protein
VPFLNRFGSVQVNRFLHYKTKNRTEPGFFLTILIGLISFFFGSVFSVNFFSVFSVYSVFRFFCTPLIWRAIYIGVEETSVLLFLNKFDVIFFFHMTTFNWFIFLVAPLYWFWLFEEICRNNICGREKTF